MDILNTPKCPVNGCQAKKFANVAIENFNPTLGGHSIFVVQCDQGHIIGPSVGMELRDLLEHQRKLLVEILEEIKASNSGLSSAL